MSDTTLKEEVPSSGEGESKTILVAFDGEKDPFSPLNFSTARKWFITFVVLNGSFCVAATSSIYTSTYDQLIAEFHTSYEVVTLGLTFFVLGLGIAPLFLGPLSEFYGRKPIYSVSFFFFFVWQIPCAFAPDMAVLLVFRFLAGVSGSAFLSVSGGTVSDLFAGPKLTLPMSFFSASPFLGPVAGPLIGGFINQYTNWRWTFRVLMIWTALLWAALVLVVPETYGPAVLKQKAKKLRKDSGNSFYKAPIEVMDKSLARTILLTLKRPFILITEPMVLLLNTWTSLLLAILYLFFSAFDIVFEGEHDFTLSQVGMSFLGIGLGILFAVAITPLIGKIQRNLIAKHGNSPEIVLVPGMIGAILAPIGLFWFAFTTNVFWIVPILAGVPFGIAVVLIFASVFAFLVRSYTPWAASAMASNSMERSLLAGVFPLFAKQMYDNVGDRWASAILAFLVLAMAPLPFIFYKYGARIRQNSHVSAMVYAQKS